VLRELPVRKRLKNLRSGLFVVDEERDEQGRLVAVVLRGAGFGHGAGMCQQGAIGMAEAGAGYADILRHYYAGAEVKKVF
jgi:SpoIID/LytB domain protein